jgi:hypothetical protein
VESAGVDQLAAWRENMTGMHRKKRIVMFAHAFRARYRRVEGAGPEGD